MTGDGVDWGSTLCAALNDLRGEGAFCDTTIVGSDQKTLRAHACVLAAASPTLKACLKLAKECTYIVPVGQMSSSTWQGVLQFVYTGQVSVTAESDVVSLSKAASTLQIRGFQTALETAVADIPVTGETDVDESRVASDLDEDDRRAEALSSADDVTYASQWATSKKTVAKRKRMRRRQPPTPGLNTPEAVNVTTIEGDLESEHESDDGATQTESANGVNKSATCGKAKPTCLCSVCGKALSSNTSLARHMLLHGDREKTYQCHLCDSSFLSPQALKYHSRSHTGEMPYRCQVCGKLFRCLNALPYHMKIHTGEKPFVCDICGKAFRSLTGMTVHRRSHTGEKPYACNVCGKTFITTGSRAQHTWVHDGKKPYPCDLCDKAYTSSSKLKIHRRKHTGEKPFMCETCGQCFNRWTALKIHMATHKTFLESSILASQEW